MAASAVRTASVVVKRCAPGTMPLEMPTRCAQRRSPVAVIPDRIPDWVSEEPPVPVSVPKHRKR